MSENLPLHMTVSRSLYYHGNSVTNGTSLTVARERLIGVLGVLQGAIIPAGHNELRTAIKVNAAKVKLLLSHQTAKGALEQVDSEEQEARRRHEKVTAGQKTTAD